VINHLLPALRACVAKELYEKHNFSQVSIASVLDVSQPAVSKYLSGDYDRKAKSIMRDKGVSKIVNEIAVSIAENKISSSQVTSLILKHCSQLIKENSGVF
jgi:predicted transcriptional regulator